MLLGVKLVDTFLFFIARHTSAVVPLRGDVGGAFGIRAALLVDPAVGQVSDFGDQWKVSATKSSRVLPGIAVAVTAEIAESFAGDTSLQSIAD